MSGSGYGGSAGSPQPSQATDCARYTKETILSSPQPAVIGKLRPNEQLEVAFESQTDQRVIVAKTGSDEIAGSITGEGRLRTCMIEGHQYVAIVQSVNGGACRVQIRIKA
jgi:hypothetical protein